MKVNKLLGMNNIENFNMVTFRFSRELGPAKNLARMLGHLTLVLGRKMKVSGR
jgi:hypothetical protein